MCSSRFFRPCRSGKDPAGNPRRQARAHPPCLPMRSLEYSSATSSVSLAILKNAPVTHPTSLGFAFFACMLLNAVCASAEPVIIRDCESCPELVVIPAGGSFVMGAEDAEGLAWGMPEALAANERPVAAITIAHSYAIGRTEVTRGPVCGIRGRDGLYDNERLFSPHRLGLADAAGVHPGATTASAIPTTIRRRACGSPRYWPTWTG